MRKSETELIALVYSISDGKCGIDEARKKLDQIEQEDADTFLYYKLEKKEKPWDMKYLMELKSLFFSGASSREFIEYMAEVSEEVYRAKRIRKIFLSILMALAAIAAIIAIIRCFGGH